MDQGITITEPLAQALHYAYITSENLVGENNEIKEIQGLVTGGNININGDSALRRSGSLQMIVNPEYANILDIANIISYSKQIRISIGIQEHESTKENKTDLGVFVITNASVVEDSSGIKVSVTIKDRMALLNGEIGGTIRDTIIISSSKDSPPTKRPMNDIIPNILALSPYDFDKEIERFSDTIDNTVRWGSVEPLHRLTLGSYTYKDDNNKEIPVPIYQLIKSDGKISDDKLPTDIEVIHQNEDVGYQQVEYTWPDGVDLIANPGDTIVSLLEKVKKEVGNYEFFFDVNGVFHFQQIQNGIDMGTEIENLAKAINEVLPNSIGSSVCTFDESNFITAYSLAPNYSRIKNDIVAWGQRGDTKTPLRYHLIIDNKSKSSWGYNKNSNIPWQEQYLNQDSDPYGIKEELLTEWGKIYKDGNYQITGASGLYGLSWYIDILDPEDINNEAAKNAIEALCVYNIGRREKVIKNTGINSVFRAASPKLYFIYLGKEDTSTQRQYAVDNGFSFVQVKEGEFPLQLGTTKNDAYNNVRIELNNILGNGDQVSLTIVPIYNLEPNIKVHIKHDNLKINGDYMIKSISMPLAPGGVSNVTATRIISRI